MNEELLNSEYLTAKDLQKIIPGIGYIQSLKIITDVQKEMQDKGYLIPNTKAKVALTKLVRKKLGI